MGRWGGYDMYDMAFAGVLEGGVSGIYMGVF